MRLTRVRTDLPGFTSDNLSFNPSTASLKASWIDADGTTLPAGAPIATLSFIGGNISPCFNISFNEKC